MLSMHCISRPANARSSRQNRTFILIFDRSKSRCKRRVPSLPRLSKSKNRMTSWAPSVSISVVASRKDLPPVFTVTITPFTPKMRSACSSFLPSTTIGLPFADSSTSLVMICRIFSSFSLSFVDTVLPCYLGLPHRFQAVFGFIVICEVSPNRLQYICKFGCNAVFKVHRMQFAL